VDRPPNILVVLSDEHTAAAGGWAGHPHIRTPHLDRLAAQGVSFDRAYTNSPMCVPSRLSLMAEQYVHQLGDIAGLAPNAALPGHTLLDPVDRPVLSEYHAQGMVDGGIMLRSGRWKYVWYGGGHAPQVFDLDADPLEVDDLSTATALVAKLDSELRSIVDPDELDARAKADQAERFATLTRG
jgi:arylsulfatase A-like enzyme